MQNFSLENNSAENRTLGCVNFESKESNLHFDGVFDIDPKELAVKLTEVVIVDVRQPEEYDGELGHIPTSKLMVLDTLDETLGQLPKDKTIVFVCRSGGRSARAAALAQEMGYKSVYNLKGGMLFWNDLHLPTEI